MPSYIHIKPTLHLDETSPSLKDEATRRRIASVLLRSQHAACRYGIDTTQNRMYKRRMCKRTSRLMLLAVAEDTRTILRLTFTVETQICETVPCIEHKKTMNLVHECA